MWVMRRNGVVIGARQNNKKNHEDKSDSLADAQVSHGPIPPGFRSLHERPVLIAELGSFVHANAVIGCIQHRCSSTNRQELEISSETEDAEWGWNAKTLEYERR